MLPTFTRIRRLGQHRSPLNHNYMYENEEIIMPEIVDRLNEVLESIATASKSIGQENTTAQLIAVSKTYPSEVIRPLLEHGFRRFGENRVQEAQGKWPELKAGFSDIDLHLIGPLQSNKAADAVALFDTIQTVDREKIAKVLSAEISRQNRSPRLFVQVNTGNEPQKAGIDPLELVAFVEKCRSQHGLSISGLMCIPPFDENPGPHFALLKKLAAECQVKELSMGMSSDFETAVEFGATHVRVGSAIFGARDYTV